MKSKRTKSKKKTRPKKKHLGGCGLILAGRGTKKTLKKKIRYY